MKRPPLLDMRVPSIFKPKPQAFFSLEVGLRLLKKSAHCQDLRTGKAVHALLITANDEVSDENLIQNNYLINLYSKCNDLSTARQLFGRMCKRNHVSWASLMSGHLKGGFVSDVLGLFKNMMSDGILCPNEYILSVVLSGCGKNGLLFEGQQCHGYVFKSGLLLHQYVINALVSMYSVCSEVEGAMKVLSSAPDADILPYNSIINGLLDSGYLNKAIDTFQQLVNKFIVWDGITYTTVFGLCAQVKDLNLGRQIHSRMLRSDVECDVYLGSAVMDMYGKCNDISSARRIFNNLQSQNAVTWTSIMYAYLHNEFFEDPLKLFLGMQYDAAALPNEFTYAVLLNSCAGLSAVGFGNSLHAHIEKTGFKGHIDVGNALINMYSRSGEIEAAYMIFTKMTYRDVISWNSMISSFSHHGLGREGLLLFEEMLCCKQRPTYVTFIGVLSACGQLGLVEEGYYYLHHLMIEMGIRPGLEHYTCMVGLLSRIGKLDEAEKFMKATTIDWDVVAWRILLNACYVHKRYDLGQRVAQFMLDLNPNDVGTLLLLSNMHAKTKRWEGVAKIRGLMREKNIKKEPGMSWTEIRNNTHVFISDDSHHPESDQIYQKVRELVAKIKPLGYVPDMTSSLHDVEEEQKEDNLSYHSEKLAIAYGLMKTPEQATLRVIKNLRMCEDCHSATKLISQVTNRLIVVRDINRFHRFQDGQCSCADCW